MSPLRSLLLGRRGEVRPPGPARPRPRAHGRARAARLRGRRRVEQRHPVCSPLTRQDDTNDNGLSPNNFSNSPEPGGTYPGTHSHTVPRHPLAECPFRLQFGTFPVSHSFRIHFAFITHSFRFISHSLRPRFPHRHRALPSHPDTKARCTGDDEYAPINLGTRPGRRCFYLILPGLVQY